VSSPGCSDAPADQQEVQGTAAGRRDKVRKKIGGGGDENLRVSRYPELLSGEIGMSSDLATWG
jgi:hypothetical protein